MQDKKTKQLFISSFGLSSAFGKNLAEHQEKIKKENFSSCTISLRVEAGGEIFNLPYYKQKSTLLDFLKTIPKLPKKTALFIGSCSLGIELNEKEYIKRGFTHLGYDLLIPDILKALDIEGGHYLFNTACTSSANALLYASKMIRSGIIDDAIILGLEMQNSLSLYGFLSLGLLSKSSLKPFDKNRDGIVLGEALCFIHLSSLQKSRFELVSGSSVNDISSPTSPSSDGSYLSFVIENCLKKAKISADEIDLIKLHATASSTNDTAEYNGLSSIFSKLPATVALKGYTGHTLGACGVCELALLLGSLSLGIIPKSLGFKEIDKLLPVRLSDKNMDYKGEGNILLNHIAFGGNTTSLLVKDRGEI